MAQVVADLLTEVNINFAETEHLSHYSHLSILTFIMKPVCYHLLLLTMSGGKFLGDLEYLFKISSTVASAGILGKQVRKKN